MIGKLIAAILALSFGIQWFFAVPNIRTILVYVVIAGFFSFVMVNAKPATRKAVVRSGARELEVPSAKMLNR